MKNTWKVGFVGVAAGMVVAWSACASAPTTSTVSGKVAQDTFASPITTIVVETHGAPPSRVDVASDGGFELVLQKHKRYRIALQNDAGSVPLVFSGAHGTYVTSLLVPSGGAKASIGLVRFYANSSEVVPPPINVQQPPADDAACVDGAFENSAEPCIAGEAVAVCFGDDDDDSDSDSDSDSEDDDEDEGDDEDEDEFEFEGEFEGGSPELVQGVVAVPQFELTTLGCEDDDEDSED